MAVTAIATAVGYGVSTAVTAGVATLLGVATTSLVATGVGMIAGGVANSLVKNALTPSQSSSPQQTLAQPEAARGLLLNSSGNVAPIPVIYGARRIGGPWALPPTVSGSGNAYLNMVVVLSEGEIEAIDTVYLDGVASTDAKFSGLVTVEKYLGSDGQSASATLIGELPALWTSAHRLAGVAYVYVRLKYDSNVFHSVPTITADVRGRKVYDPRTTLTAYSVNPALLVRDYLTNSRYGRAVPASAIDDATFIAVANHNEETVAIPGGTQVRYEAAGVVNPDDAMIGTLSGMLTACRGTLVFSGGKFKLIQDKAAASVFDFTADNIVGEWSVRLPGKRDRMNRVRARFFNPNKEWQADLAIQESTVYRAQDNALVLERDVDLPFTADLYRAQQIAQIEMKQSRIGIVCRFTSTIAATEVEVGDVVTITHDTPGWSGKLFRITDIELQQSDEVAITAREYDAAVYALDNLATWTPPPATNLPDPFTVEVCGTPVAIESLYETTGSAGVKARATVSWLPSPDAFVVGYELQYQQSGATVWQPGGSPTGTTVALDDIAPARYNFRVRAYNALGVTSAWASASQELYGLTAAPADVAAFYIVAANGSAEAAWQATTDTDVRIGGRVVIRHSPLTTGATWAHGIVLDEFTGGSVAATLPLMSGTYMAKFRDSTGNYSDNAASFVATEAMVTGWSTVGTSTQHTAFTGTKSGCAVVDSTLRIDSALTVGDMTSLISTWPKLGSLGGVASAASYDFAAPLDMTTVATRRFDATIGAQSFDTGDTIGARGLVSTWDSVGGTVVNDCDATLFISTTADDPAGSPTWGGWVPFFVGDFTCRAARFRLDIASGSATHNIAIDTLSVRARIPA